MLPGDALVSQNSIERIKVAESSNISQYANLRLGILKPISTTYLLKNAGCYAHCHRELMRENYI